MTKETNEIAQFVEQVLVGISDGVRAAQAHARTTRGIPIAVGVVNDQPVNVSQNHVEFELNVSITKGKSGTVTGGADGIALKLVGVSASGTGEISTTDAANHKIRFSVPVYFSADYVRPE